MFKWFEEDELNLVLLYYNDWCIRKRLLMYSNFVIFKTIGNKYRTNPLYNTFENIMWNVCRSQQSQILTSLDSYKLKEIQMFERNIQKIQEYSGCNDPKHYPRALRKSICLANASRIKGKYPQAKSLIREWQQKAYTF